jgi:hypothetical protein
VNRATESNGLSPGKSKELTKEPTVNSGGQDTSFAGQPICFAVGEPLEPKIPAIQLV